MFPDGSVLELTFRSQIPAVAKPACNSLTSGAVGVENEGLTDAQKRAISAASTASALVRKSSLLANPLILAGLTILT